MGSAHQTNQTELLTRQSSHSSNYFNMITVEGLTKRYANHVAVDNISFKVERGQIVGFLGPNGAGKTTTMRVLTCFLPPTSGSARVAEFDVLEQPMEVKKRIGYLPETPPLYPEMEVVEYLEYVGRLKGVPKESLARRVDEVAQKCSVGDVKNRLIGKLSKGYRQRVGLAQAIIHNPDVLILDEPTSGLDPQQIIETRDLIKGLAGDHTIILSTHILPEVEQLCERVIIIAKGKLVATDTVQNLTSRLGEPRPWQSRSRRAMERRSAHPRFNSGWNAWKVSAAWWRAIRAMAIWPLRWRAMRDSTSVRNSRAR